MGWPNGHAKDGWNFRDVWEGDVFLLAWLCRVHVVVLAAILIYTVLFQQPVLAQSRSTFLPTVGTPADGAPAEVGYAQVPDEGRDTRMWTDPGGSGLEITFSTPEKYFSCDSEFDRIYSEGIPDNWELDGIVSVYWSTTEGLELVPDGTYVVQQTGNLDLTISYPPAWEWPDLTPVGNPLRELTVDLSIVLRNENDDVVTWVGGDLAAAPGVLGPEQDWNVSCNPPSLTLGDRVWYDQNENGIQDVDEPGLNGITVDLYDTPGCTGASIARTFTGVEGPPGFYEFSELSYGVYCLQFSNIPPGALISPADQGNGANDSKANENARIVEINLTGNNAHADIGMYASDLLGLMCAF